MRLMMPPIQPGDGGTELGAAQSKWEVGYSCQIIMSALETTVNWWRDKNKPIVQTTRTYRIDRVDMDVRFLKMSQSLSEVFLGLRVINHLLTALVLIILAWLLTFLATGFRVRILLIVAFIPCALAFLFSNVGLVGIGVRYIYRGRWASMSNFPTVGLLVIMMSNIFISGAFFAGCAMMANIGHSEVGTSGAKNFFQSLYCTMSNDTLVIGGSSSSDTFGLGGSETLDSDTCTTAFTPYNRAFHALCLIAMMASVASIFINMKVTAKVLVHVKFCTVEGFWLLEAYFTPMQNQDPFVAMDEFRREFHRFKSMIGFKGEVTTTPSVTVNNVTVSSSNTSSTQQQVNNTAPAAASASTSSAALVPNTLPPPIATPPPISNYQPAPAPTTPGGHHPPATGIGSYGAPPPAGPPPTGPPPTGYAPTGYPPTGYPPTGYPAPAVAGSRPASGYSGDPSVPMSEFPSDPARRSGYGSQY